MTLLVFDGCDLMDVVGPYEVLLTANRLRGRAGDAPLFRVRTASIDGEPVTGYGGLGIVPTHGPLGEVPAPGVLVVPGLVDIAAGRGDRALVGALRRAGGLADVVASVCTGTFLLDAAGLLGDATVTTHWEDVDELARVRGAGAVRSDVRWVDEGRVVTSGGISSGIAMALHLVQRFADRALAEAVARQIDYVWTADR